MNSQQEIVDQLNEDDRELVYLPKRRKEVKELKTRYDYQKMLAKKIQKPIGYIFAKTRGWPLEWFYQLHSLIKYEKNITKHPVVINSFIKNVWK